MALQLEFLCSLRLPSLVKQRLGALPPNLYKIYDENYSQKFESYEEEEKRIVESAFRFLLCAQEKIDTKAFLQALSVLDPVNSPLSPDSLLDLCFNFIVVDSQLDVFRFAHLSVREYLEAKSHYEQTRNHALAAECCIKYLSSDGVVTRYGFDAKIVTEDELDSEHLPYVRTPYFADSEVPGPIIAPTDGSLRDDHVLLHTEFHRYACILWAFHLANSGNFRLIFPLKDISYAFLMDHQQATSVAYWVWNKDAYYYWRGMDDSEYMGMREKLCWALARSRAADYLFAACLWGFEDLLEIRIRATLNPVNGELVYDSGRALFVATKFGRYTAVRLLLKHGADLNWSNILGRTALHQSVVGRSPQICQALLEKGADPSVHDVRATTPLSLAVKNGDVEITTMLLRYGSGASFDVENGRFGQITPLEFAARDGAVEIAELLLNYGADPNIYNNWYDTPLWYAAIKGNLELLRILFNYGAHAPTEFRDSFGRRIPSSLAQEGFNTEVVKLLQEHGFPSEAELELEERD